MKNIKDKIFAILAAAVILIGTGEGAGSGVLPYPDAPTVPGIEEKDIPTENPADGSTPKTEARPNCDLTEDDQFDE